MDMFESCRRLPFVGEVVPENMYKEEPIPVSIELIEPSEFLKSYKVFFYIWPIYYEIGLF